MLELSLTIILGVVIIPVTLWIFWSPPHPPFNKEITLSVSIPNPDWYEDVLDFHKKFGCEINRLPLWPRNKLQYLRAHLNREEMDELNYAVSSANLPEIADSITDLIYVLIGMAISYGIDLRPIWNEVHKTNMLKEGGKTRDDGKILKPEGWEPPKIKELLKKQEPIQ